MQRLIISLTLILALTFTTVAQTDNPCPYGGREDCTGWCGQFTDSDGNGYCDYGVLSQKTKDSLNKVAKHKAVKPADKKKDKVKEAAVETKTANGKQAKTTKQLQNKDNSEVKAETTKKAPKPYNFVLIVCVTLGLYILSAILVKTRVLKKTTHRKIWNIVLLVSFLVSCLGGLFMVIQINYNVALSILPTIRFYHVQFGIAMTLIAIFHIFWHIPYFKNMFK